MTYGNDSIHVTRFRDGEENSQGLTKREYFAAMAMQGYVSAGCNGMPDAKRIGELALETADALIKALNKADQ
jgi:hypothetical protein